MITFWVVDEHGRIHNTDRQGWTAYHARGAKLVAHDVVLPPGAGAFSAPLPVRIATTFEGLGLGCCGGPWDLWRTVVVGGVYDGNVWGRNTETSARAKHDQIVAAISRGDAP